MTAFEAGAMITAVGACVTDLHAARIPNALTIGSAATGLVAHAMLAGGSGLGSSLGGAATGLLVFLPFFALGGLGGGDVKLMAALGAWLGPASVLETALYTALAGGVLALVVAIRHRYLGEALTNLRALTKMWALMGPRAEPALTLERGRGPRLPYAVPILAGLIVMIWRR